MCNRYGYLSPITRLVDEFSQVRIPLRFKDGAIPNTEPREHIRPTNIAPIIRPLDRTSPSAGVEMVDARWWLIPFFHRKSVKDWKPMCTNARAETVATASTFREAFKRRRCLVPATHFFEWTGPVGSKVMWRFTKANSEVFCFPGLWDVAETTDGRIEPYHNRQPVVLEPDQWATWLDLSADPAPCLRAGLAGVIAVERATEAAAAG